MADEAIVTTPMVLVATWRDGLFVVSGETRDQELGAQSVRVLAPDEQGGAVAIVNGRSLRRRAPDGGGAPLRPRRWISLVAWDVVIESKVDLSELVPISR
jgi:hypothetical protein